MSWSWPLWKVNLGHLHREFHAEARLKAEQYFPFNLTSQCQASSFFPVPFQVSFRSSVWVLNCNSTNMLACNSLGWTWFYYCSHTRLISLDSLLGLGSPICSQHLSDLLALGLSLPTTRHLNHTSRQIASRQNDHGSLRILRNHSTSQFLFPNALIIWVNRWDPTLKTITI